MPASPSTTLSDVELLERARAGDTEAYGELWRRHQPAARRAAAAVTTRYEPDDLVVEAFMRIYDLIRRGKGPETGFRSYLFRSIRNISIDWARSAAPVSLDDADKLEDPSFSEESTSAALDRALTVQAFTSLPARWQEVLWYSEVEQLSPQRIAPILGMKPSAVSTLAHRAREGLRVAWIQAHIASVPAGSEHAWVLERLGARARKSLSRRDAARVEAHLGTCTKCLTASEEADRVGSRLALVLLPLALGAAGSVGYLASLQTGGVSAAVAAEMPSTILTGALAPTASGASSATVAATAGLLTTPTLATAGVSSASLAAIAVGAVLSAVVAGAVAFGAFDAGPLVPVDASVVATIPAGLERFPTSAGGNDTRPVAQPHSPGDGRTRPDRPVVSGDTTSGAPAPQPAAQQTAASPGEPAPSPQHPPLTESPSPQVPPDAGNPASPGLPAQSQTAPLAIVSPASWATVDTQLVSVTGTAAASAAVQVAVTGPSGVLEQAVVVDPSGNWSVVFDLTSSAAGDYTIIATQQGDPSSVRSVFVFSP